MRFQCLDSCGGQCCKIEWGSRDVNFVFLTKIDRIRLAAHFAGKPYVNYSSKGEFKYTRFTNKKSQQWFLNKDKTGRKCIFLKDGKCSVYEARPTQCRTFPFWPELIHEEKNWAKVKTICPGIDKGDEVTHALLDLQVRADRELCPK